MVFSIVNPPLPVASIVPALMTALLGGALAVPGLSLSMVRVGRPLALMMPDCSLTSTKCRVAAADIAGASDGAEIIEFGWLRSADDLGRVVKLKGSLAFERNRSINRGRAAQVQRAELIGVYGAAIGDGDI